MLEIYTDGACKNNGRKNAVGGWSFVVTQGGKLQKVKRRALNKTTNQRTEMTAVIKALDYSDGPVKIYTDSKYVANGINSKWYEAWQRNGWRNAQREPVKNKDLWERLIKLVEQRKPIVKWVPGHSGNEFNELADEHARFSCTLLRKGLK